ncbi:MAG: FecR domain-containing protein [Pseudomonadota bacterium]
MSTRKLSQAEHEAADWIVRLEAKPASASERAAFEFWRKDDPAHAEAFALMSQHWDSASLLADAPDYDHLVAEPLYERWALRLSEGLEHIRNLIAWPCGARWRAGGLLAGLALMGASAWLAVSVTDTEPGMRHATAIAEIREEILPDNSRVTLGARSVIDLAFTDGERRVRLIEGEAFFDVVSDPNRPFYVDTGHSIIRVVGTQFGVRRTAGQVHVAVKEGVVEVANRNLRPIASRMLSGSEPAVLVLTAGQRLLLDDAAALGAAERRPSGGGAARANVESVAVDDVAAWRSGRLVYVNARMSEVIADLNRYHPAEIVLGDDEVGDLYLTASLRVEEAEALIGMITASMPVAAETRSDGYLVLSLVRDSGD